MGDVMDVMEMENDLEEKLESEEEGGRRWSVGH